MRANTSLSRLRRSLASVDWSAVPWRDRYDAASAFAWWGVAEIAVRWLRLPALAKLFGVSLSDAEDSPGPAMRRADLPPWAQRRVSAVVRVQRRWPVHGSCLRLSLVLGHQLRALSPTLRIGVARDGSELRAHAWIEIDRHPLDATTDRFVVLR